MNVLTLECRKQTLLSLRVTFACANKGNWLGRNRICFQGHFTREKMSCLFIGRQEAGFQATGLRQSHPLPHPRLPSPPRAFLGLHSLGEVELRKCFTPTGKSPLECILKSCLICRTGPEAHNFKIGLPDAPDRTTAPIHTQWVHRHSGTVP